MAKRVLIFITAALLMLLFNIWWVQQQNQQANPANQGGEETQTADNDPPLVAPPPSDPAAQPAPVNPPVAQGPQEPQQRVTIGSADPESDYVMLVTANNRGGVIERIELNNPRFRELEARREGRGYPGELAVTDAPAGGVIVNAVGAGTPAAAAGLKVGDRITAIKTGAGEPTPVTSVLEWNAALRGDDARIGDKWSLEIQTAAGETATREVTLAPIPLSLVAPEFEGSGTAAQPLSMRLTLQSLWDASQATPQLIGEIPAATSLMDYLTDGAEGGVVVGRLPEDNPLYLAGLRPGDYISKVDSTAVSDAATLREYLAGVASGSLLRIEYGSDPVGLAYVQLPYEMPQLQLHNVTWKVSQPAENVVEFRYLDAQQQLEFVKRFTLAKKADVDAARRGEELPPIYHLTMDMEIINHGPKRELVYQIDGFNGLPTEGFWYSSKIARGWFEGVGARDVMMEFEDRSPDLIGAPRIDKYDDLPTPGGEAPLRSISTDARYFATSLIPLRENPNEIWFDRALAVRVGMPRSESKESQLTNTSFRLLSTKTVLEPGGSVSRSFRLFTGPKSNGLLEDPEYNLSELVYYGWPIWGIFAKVLQAVLHFIYGIIPNYGVAILLLTVMVRGAMYPLSRRNALGAQKMQMLQPEIRRLNEKYKNNPQEKMRQTQELFRKHNYHPLGGCLVLFLQLPIFIGLYRALMLDVELRQAPLIPGFTAWCDNLAAPDMLFDWSNWSFMPDFLVSTTGWLGPYFNLLPIITIGLFIAQQKILMPPALDDQQRMQQKVMKYMMVFFAFMFFRVPSGLCLYFIASSLWGLAERKLLPKPSAEQQKQAAELAAQGDGDSPRERRRQAAGGSNGSAIKSNNKKKRT